MAHNKGHVILESTLDVRNIPYENSQPSFELRPSPITTGVDSSLVDGGARDERRDTLLSSLPLPRPDPQCPAVPTAKLQFLLLLQPRLFHLHAMATERPTPSYDLLSPSSTALDQPVPMAIDQ